MYKILLRPLATMLSIKPIPTYKLVAFPKGANVFKFAESKDMGIKNEKEDQNKSQNSTQKQKQDNQPKQHKKQDNDVFNKNDKDSQINKIAKNENDMRGQKTDKGEKKDWEKANKQEHKDSDKNKNKTGNEWQRESSINQQTSNFTGGQKQSDLQGITKDKLKNQDLHSNTESNKTGQNSKKQSDSGNDSTKHPGQKIRDQVDKMQSGGSQGQKDNISTMNKNDTNKNDSSNTNKDQKNDSNKRDQKDKKNDDKTEINKKFQPAH